MTNRALFSIVQTLSLAERTTDKRVRLKVNVVSPCGIDLLFPVANWTIYLAMSAAPPAERAINKPCSSTEFLVIRQCRSRGQLNAQTGTLNRKLKPIPEFSRSTGVLLIAALLPALNGARLQPRYCICCELIVGVQLTFGCIAIKRFHLLLQALTQLREGEALRD